MCYNGRGEFIIYAEQLFDWKEVLFHPAFTRGVRDPSVTVGGNSLSIRDWGVPS